MKVKIGNKVYDPNETPIMVILTKEDKSNIANMHPTATKYAAFPDAMSVECIEEWMLLGESEIEEDEREMEGKSNDWTCDMCGAQNDDSDSACYGCMAERV